MLRQHRMNKSEARNSNIEFSLLQLDRFRQVTAYRQRIVDVGFLMVSRVIVYERHNSSKWA